jgi:hypothetical protein
MKIREYLSESNMRIDKAWKDFEKVAKAELGRDWDGTVTGDMIYGNLLSDKAKKLYRKYFDLLGGK